jgi:hypothetical protein
MRLIAWLVLLAAGAAMLWWVRGAWGAPYLTNDGYQYLDAASHIASGQCACADLAHFDEQVEYGRLPVPFTHFPPGYPALIAGLLSLGLPPETAGYAISAVGFLLSLTLLFDIAVQLGASPIVAAAFGSLWIWQALALTVASNVGTEAIFIAVLMLVAAGMVRDARNPGSRPALLLWIGIAAGSAYWIRQAGLFAIPVAGLYLARRFWQGGRTRWWAGAGLVSLLTLMGTLQARNILHTGAWRGGFSSGSSHSLQWVLVESVKALYHLLFGDRAVARLDAWALLFVASATVLLWSSWRARRQATLPPGSLAGFSWTVALIAMSAGGVMAAALVSIASEMTRYYLPLYPLLLACSAAAFCWVPSTKLRSVALGGALLAVLGIHTRSMTVVPVEPLHHSVDRALNSLGPDGSSVKQWLTARLGPHDSLLAARGQALHYVLQRPVVSLIEPEYSSLRADESELHQRMLTFHSRYMVLFPSATPNTIVEQSTNPFLSGLVAGSTPPTWLATAVRTTDVAVFECMDCVP